MDAATIAESLRTIGALLSLQGVERFKADAYIRGARAVEAAKDLERLVLEGRLEELPGIGKALSQQITEMVTTGRSSLLEKLDQTMPPGARNLAPVATLKQIERLSAGLGVTTIAELEAAALAGRVREVKGFGAATEARLLQKIRAFREEPHALRMRAGRAVALRIIDHLRRDGLELTAVGAVRRGDETLEHVELLAVGDAETRRLAARDFVREAEVIEITRDDDLAVSARLVDGSRATLHLVGPSERGSALVRTTGPEAHAAEVLGAPPGRAFADEVEAYAALDRHVVPPELRDVPGVLARAKRPFELVTARDVRGAIHCHTRWSDGKDSILDMARAAEAAGLDYITITDHSPTASYAGGVGLDRLFAQWEEIDQAQAETRVRILRGTESDILADGALDYPDDVLERFDIVIASIHNRYAQDEDAMTRRLVTAMRHPIQKVWGHPFGRLLLRRPPVPCRFDEVLDAIVLADAIIELNGDPWRLDMPSEEARAAHARGIRFAIGVDAHAADELRNVHNAVTLARRAGLTAEDVVNTRPLDEFLRIVHPTGNPRPF